MDLVQCIYCSTCTNPSFAAPELKALLDNCRTSNAARNVTGMLLFHAGAFFQVLEGDRTVVEALFEKISSDKRHCNAKKIILEPIAERAFAAWTMGHSGLGPRELGAIQGLNDFFARGQSYQELDEGRAKMLLAAFKEGRWRATLS
jgi:Sensors of blue-light using FAD